MLEVPVKPLMSKKLTGKTKTVNSKKEKPK